MRIYINKFLILIEILSIVQLNNCQEVHLEYDLYPKGGECLYEYIPESTLALFDVGIDNCAKYSVTLKDPDNKLLETTAYDSFYKSITTVSSGYYELCTHNLNDKEDCLVKFNLKYGVSAFDYSSLAKSKDLEPFDVEMQKITDKKEIFEHYGTVGRQHDKVFDVSLDSISTKIVFYSLILMGTMILIGLVESIYLKRYMKRRKII